AVPSENREDVAVWVHLGLPESRLVHRGRTYNSVAVLVIQRLRETERNRCGETRSRPPWQPKLSKRPLVARSCIRSVHKIFGETRILLANVCFVRPNARIASQSAAARR